MIGVVVVSHANFAKELLDVIEHIVDTEKLIEIIYKISKEIDGENFNLLPTFLTSFNIFLIGFLVEIFILDMGKSIKILDLAKQMIKMNGFIPRIQHENTILNQNNEIGIKFFYVCGIFYQRLRNNLF